MVSFVPEEVMHNGGCVDLDGFLRCTDFVHPHVSKAHIQGFPAMRLYKERGKNSTSFILTVFKSRVILGKEKYKANNPSLMMSKSSMIDMSPYASHRRGYLA